MANFLLVLSKDDNEAATRRLQFAKSRFFPNMVLDGAPHLIGLAAKAKVFNF